MVLPGSVPRIHSVAERRIWAFRLLGLLGVFVLLLPYPFNDDSAHWHSMAFDLLAFGRWPYLSSWDQSWPGDLLVHIPPILLFGPGELGFQTFDALIQTGFCLVLYKLWRTYLPDRTAWIAVLLYAFYYVYSDPFVGGKRDVYASSLVLAAAYLLIRLDTGQGSRLTRIYAGLLTGIAILIRPTYASYLILFIALIPRLREFRSSAILILTAAIPMAISYLVYALKPGGITEYWTSTVLFNRDLYTSIAHPFSEFLRGMSSPKMLSLPAILFLVLLLTRRVRTTTPNIPRKHLRLYISFVTVSLALVLLMRKYYLYHFTMYAILLTPLAAQGVEAILHRIPARIRLPLFVGTFLILSLPLKMLYRHALPAASRGDFRQGIVAAYRAAVWEDTSERGVMDYFERPEHLTGRVEVCSFDPRLRIHLHREPAGIYASLHPLGFRTNPADPNSFTSYQLVWRHAYMDSLTRLRPAYIVIAHATFAEYLEDPYASTLHTLPGFDSLLRMSYRLDTLIGADAIFRLR